MKKNYIEVNYTKVNDEPHIEYCTIADVVKKLQVEEIKILYWCNKFQELLNIKSIGEYMLFSNIDVQNLQTIKELNIDQGLNIEETKKALQERSNALIIQKPENHDNEAALINFFMSIYSQQNQALKHQNQKIDKLISVCETMIESNENAKQFIVDTLSDTVNKNADNIKAEIKTDFKKELTQKAAETNNMITEYRKDTKKDFTQNAKDINKKFIDNQRNIEKYVDKKIDDVKSHMSVIEREATKKETMEIAKMRNSMEEKHNQLLEHNKNNKKNKGFFHNIFGKKE